MVQIVGARLMPGGQGLRPAIWGTVALTLGCLTPYVGWFGLLPYVVIRGLGAFVLTLFGRHQKVVAETWRRHPLHTKGAAGQSACGAVIAGARSD